MTMQYYIFIAFLVGGAFLEHFAIEPVFFPRPKIVTASTTTTTVHGAPIPQPPLVATGDAVGVVAGEIASPKPASHPRRVLAAPVAARIDSIPIQPPKKYYQHPAALPIGFLRGTSAVLNTKMSVKWEFSGTGIPTTVPENFKSRVEVLRPDSIPEKTVELKNTIIEKSVGYKWFFIGTGTGIVLTIGGKLLYDYAKSKNGAW